MPTWIALFRGVNVGGKNIMPMAKLKMTLESISCGQVKTYIQSGNVVFNSRVKNEKKLNKRVLDAVEQGFGFRPKLMLVSESQLRETISNNPFQSACPEPKTLHFFFLDGEPDQENHDSVKALASKSEQFKLVDRVFYIHAPDGFGKSKLASSLERKLGVVATARNYATIEKLVSMIGE